MAPYEIIEHTADVRLKVNGTTLKELFENAARGMSEIIGGIKKSEICGAKENKEIKIEKETSEIEELLVDWLSELLYIFNKEEILFYDFKISRLDNKGISARLSGQKIDLSQASLQTEIKACTFHGLKIEEDEKGFRCKIIFDV